ncbi:MAG: MATE family efflux transporter [Chloroflexi bacterium]|nr:MATE family efflux transporter [Chloroflexota bacterium]
MHQKSHKSDRMGRDSIWRLLFLFSGPAIVSNVVGASYNIVDTVYVGRLGTGALAAMTISNPIMMIFMAIETGTAVGAASLISRRFGAGKHEEASRIASITATLAILIGILTAAVCLPTMNGLLRLFGANDAVLPMAKSYLSILVIFAFIDAYYMMMGTIIRAEGSPVFSSSVFIISAISNVILDPIMIYGWFGFPAMGIAGAAAATVISRGIGGVIFIIYFMSGKSAYKFRPSYFIPKFSILKEIYRVGFAAIARQGGWSIMLIFANRVAMSFGVTTVAVFGVVNRANSLARMPSFGISQGMIPLVGYNYGAKKMDRVGEVVVKACKAALLWGSVCAVIALLFPGQILSIFNSEPQFLQQGVIAIRIFSIAYLFMGMQFNLSYFFQAIGKGMASLIVGLSREFLFILPAIYLFTSLADERGI